jgi:hypothetical protein
MNSGSDSDSFDEGGLTARGRKAKGKSGARASEKGKQKAKEVRNASHHTAIPSRLTPHWHYTAGVCLGGHIYSFLGHSTGRRCWESHRCRRGTSRARTATEVRSLPPRILAHTPTHQANFYFITETELPSIYEII